MAMTEPYLPQPVDRVMEAFPANVVQTHMPPHDVIPDDFRPNARDNKWVKFVEDEFFFGTDDAEMDPVEGIDPETAWKHIRAILGSYEPKHQHKIAAAAYLMSLWYDDVRWKPRVP